MPQFFGKYRGKVTNNQDPMNLARLQVSVPAVLGETRDSWAMPCVPYAGAQVGFLALPPVNANVWVEFEDGDPDYPIWSGCFWGPGEMPSHPGAAGGQMVQDPGITLTFSEVAPTLGVTLEVSAPLVSQPLTLKMNAEGITLSCGTQTSLKLTAQEIALANNQQTSLTLTAQSLACRSGQTSSATMTADAVDVQQGPAALKLAASGIALSHNPAAVHISAQGVELQQRSRPN